MITGNYYGITGFVCALVCAAILRCNDSIYDRDSKVRKYFSTLMVHFVLFEMVDCVWGFMNTGALALGRTAFYVVSFAVHLYIIFVVMAWCFFITGYFGFKENRLITVLQFAPFIFALFFLALQVMFGNVIYDVDESCRYTVGPLRISLFYIQYSYYLIAIGKIVYFLIRHRKEYTMRYKLIVLESAVIPIIFCVFKLLDPEGPYCSLGLMFSAVFVFDGMMVIEKLSNSQKYEMISKESYMTLNALADGFISVILIDLETMQDTVVKSTPFADSLIEAGMPLREKILKIFTSSAMPEFQEELKEFTDIDHLPEKLDDKRSVGTEYCSSGIGWCIVSFTAVERDLEGKVRKAVLVVQSIDEKKKKEKEYEDALARAYKNENAVFAELIKMESTGIIASQERKIIIVNDAALDLFGRKGTDPVGTDVFEFWKDAPIKTSEEVRDKYFDVEENGGNFSYQTVSYVDGSDKEMRYLMVDVRRIDLLDGSRVMITCFTDMTAGKLLEDKLRTLSETDALTNIANRRCGESQIRLLMKEGIGGIYCLFDVNDFKRINDTFGHQTGDDTLVAVAGAIRASFRADDIFMRLGGDEFAIYMRNVATADLAKIRIARLFENIARIELPNIPKGSVTISLGAVLVESLDGVITAQYDDVYRQADKKMYQCKGKPGSNLMI